MDTPKPVKMSALGRAAEAVDRAYSRFTFEMSFPSRDQRAWRKDPASKAVATALAQPAPGKARSVLRPDQVADRLATVMMQGLNRNQAEALDRGQDTGQTRAARGR